ncbi:MAG: hypothetical protein ABSB87_13585 [Terriglobales bacterium]|jgi:hypothetical protein
MIRPIAALLFAGCLILQVWAQVPPAPPAQTPAVPNQAPADQVPAAAQPAGQSAGSESTQFPLDRFREFSAIQTEGMLPGSDWDGYVYRSGDLMRFQAVAQGKTQYFVDDLVKGTSYGMSLSGCAKLSLLYSRSFPFFMSGPGYTYERAAVGEDTVDGHHCHVEDITIHNKKFANSPHFRLYEADDLQGFPIKIVNQQAKVRQWIVHYKNVVLGPQDPTLFVVPRDCQELNLVHPGAPGAKPKNPPAAKPN